MRTLSTALILPLLAATAIACQEDTEGTGEDEPDEAECQEMCEDYYAEELEESPISSVDYELIDDQCTCTFLPCDDDLCTDWCVENEGIDQGVCQFLECTCIEET